MKGWDTLPGPLWPRQGSEVPQRGWRGELECWASRRHEGQVRPGWRLWDTTHPLLAWGAQGCHCPQFQSLHALWWPEGTIQAEASLVQAAPVRFGGLCLCQKPNDTPKSVEQPFYVFTLECSKT